MGDIHGNYRALQQCLDKSGFKYKTDKLIQLGDITDGYNEVYQCVELLLQIKNLVAIKGNHDDWFDQFIQTGIHPDKWIQGGYSTAYSYLKLTGKEDHLLKTDNGYATLLSPSDIPKGHQQFFRNQQLYHIDEQNNLFVHAGFDRYLQFDRQIPDTFLWDRDLWLQALSYESFNRHHQHNTEFHMSTPFNEIFIGHTSTWNWKTDKPMKAANIYNLDTGAGDGRRLTIMEVNSKKFWQSDLVNELYPIIPR